MLDGVNSSLTETYPLEELLKGREVMVRLIPYNSTSIAASYRAPSKEDTSAFQPVLSEEFNLFTTTRVEMGADIEGTCGQVALESQSSAATLEKQQGAHSNDFSSVAASLLK